MFARWTGPKATRRSRLAALTLFLSFLGVYSNTGSTPRLVLVNFIGADRLVVHRINVVGDYALADTSGGISEGQPFSLLLLKRYAFGWQVLDYLDDGLCRLDHRAIARADVAALLRGIPPQKGGTRVCEGDGTLDDVGPAHEVAAVREAMGGRGVAIPTVKVDERYAMAQWYGGGGGMAFFGKLNGAWVSLLGGGGALNPDDLTALGVPLSIACKLTYDSTHACGRAATSTVSGDGEQEAAILVDHYYRLWLAQAYSAMYASRSRAFRDSHPYARWSATIAEMNPANLVTAHAESSNRVAVRWTSPNPRSVPGSAPTPGEGTWHVVRENGTLRLDTLTMP